MAQEYKVNLPQGFRYARRVRAGVAVDKTNGYSGPLNDEQLKAIKADPFLRVEKLGGNSAEGDEPRPMTKKELLAQAEAEGLKLEVTDRNTVAEITEAIEKARSTDGNSAEGDELSEQ